jgi:transketolase C-terminal domain/subunit
MRKFIPQVLIIQHVGIGGTVKPEVKIPHISITCPNNCASIHTVASCDSGGIGEAVSAAVSAERNIVVKRLAVNAVPRSGKPEELLSIFGIDAHSIQIAVKEVLKL